MVSITLHWQYKDKYVDISMPNYVRKKLEKYKWSKPKRAQHCLFEPNQVHYGRKSDEIIHNSDSPVLKPEEKESVQQIIGSFLYYARAVDCTILNALNIMASESSNPTKRTLKRVH